MKITDPGIEVVGAATHGDLRALDAVLVAIQPGVFNLAVRMLGNRDDAADATQEILLKVVTHLGSFRAESAFPTWVFRVARNHLLTAATQSKEFPAVSLDLLGGRLQAGLNYGATLGDPQGSLPTLTPEDKAIAHQVALGCTQSMLMALDREQRLTYVLDAVFGLSSADAADVLGITASAYRQRLSRAKAALDPFVKQTCGLANPKAACRCEKQLPALDHEQRAAAAATPAAPVRPVTRAALTRGELAEAERHFSALVRMSDAAALFRGHSAYRAPDAMLGAIRAVISSEGYWPNDRPKSRPGAEDRPLQ
jgi:RNA polymerase sigma factor (sigma-70 family)